MLLRSTVMIRRCKKEYLTALPPKMRILQRLPSEDPVVSEELR